METIVAVRDGGIVKQHIEQNGSLPENDIHERVVILS
jgi:hypothetical protein